MAHPSLTKTWHNDTYAAIDPKQRSELSLNGKTVVISGGGSGVGLALTKGFADAGAQRIAILGRRDAVLQEAKKEVEANGNGVSVSTHVTDVTDAESVKLAAQDVGEWDVLVSNAGYLAEMKSVVDAEVTEWFNSFEVSRMRKGRADPLLTQVGQRQRHVQSRSLFPTEAQARLHLPRYQRSFDTSARFLCESLWIQLQQIRRPQAPGDYCSREH